MDDFISSTPVLENSDLESNSASKYVFLPIVFIYVFICICFPCIFRLSQRYSIRSRMRERESQMGELYNENHEDYQIGFIAN